MLHKCTEIDCTKFDTVLIMGQNHSNPRVSNGIGKTAIFNAIEYALFGTYPTSVLDGIVRDGTDECKVIFDFKIDDSIYRVERVRRREKNSDIKLFKQGKDGKFVSKTQRTPTETHNTLQLLLRINAKAFKNSVLFSQNDMEGLASAKSAEDRRSILTEALNLGDYQKLEKIAKDKASALSKSIIECKAVVESIGNPAIDIDTYRLKLSDVKSELIEAGKQRDQEQVLLNSKKAELLDLQRCVSSEMSESEGKLTEVRIVKKQAQNKIKTYQGSINENEQKLKTLDLKVKEKKGVLEGIVGKCDDFRNKKSRPIKKVKDNLDATAKNEVNGKAYVGSLMAKAAELRKPIPAGEECPSCHQNLTESYREHYDKEIKEALFELEQNIAEQRKKLKTCTNKKNRLQSELDEINKTFSQISLLDSSISSKKNEIANDEDYISRINILNEQANADMSVQELRLSEYIDREKTLLKAAESISDDGINLKIIAIRDEINILEAGLGKSVQIISDINTNIGVYSARVESKTEDLEKLQEIEKELGEIEKSFIMHKRVRKAFSSSGIPTMVIHTILDDLQLEGNKLLSGLRPGLEVQFTSGLDVIFRIHGREKEYKQLSGGQKTVMALSLKIGLSLVIQKRLGVNIKFLGLDEVDQSLDKATVDAYADVIRKLQDRFKIFVITHNDSLKDQFSNVILVEGDEINGVTSKLITF